nr:hypothetical protein 2 [Legionellales bacterium]
MTPRRRKDDKMIDEIRHDVKDIKKLLLGNGDVGICEQVRINQTDIKDMKARPANIKNWIVGAAIIINALVAAGALWRVL